MFPAGTHIWKLSEGGDHSLGLSCTEEGLFLAGTPLIERRAGRCAVRPQADLERLCGQAFGDGINLDPMMPGFRVVASRSTKRTCAWPRSRLCSCACRTCPIFLPGAVSRPRTCWSSAGARGTSSPAPAGTRRSTRAPGCHPTAAGSPTNRPNSRKATRTSAHPRKCSIPWLPVWQAQWDARIATLREIDPSDPQLTYVTAPGWVPNQADLNPLDAAIETVAIKRVTDRVMPGGVPIGRVGNSTRIREVSGGVDAARSLFDYLRVGGRTVNDPDLEGTLIRLHGDAGYITFRATSPSGSAAVDINVPGAPFRRIHFK